MNSPTQACGTVLSLHLHPARAGEPFSTRSAVRSVTDWATTGLPAASLIDPDTLMV